MRLSPEDALGWNLLANSYRLDGQPERALQIVNRALNVSREIPATWMLQGEILQRSRPPRAGGQAAYHEALKLDQRFGHAWLGLGKAYARLGSARSEGSRKVLEKLDPALARELAAAVAK